MSKKIIFLLIVFILFSRASLAFASPVINEIMYDLDGADIDWIEVYNPDSEDLDLTTLKLLVSNSTSNHGIIKNSGGEFLHKGDYGVIVPSSDILDYINKWGSGGNIFTASFSLPNETEKVEINNGDKNTPLSSYTYDSAQGASGDGNSLQLVNGSWKALVPTPGSTNQTTSSPSISSSNTGANSSAATETSLFASQESKIEKVVEVPAIKTKITANHLVFAGVPVEFQSKSTGLFKEVLSYGKYFWNFGDGDSKEINTTDKFTHTYFYPGEYIVSLEYYTNVYSQNSDATDKIIIKVVPVQISISKVGDEKDFFVEISNNSEYEMNLSKWIISSNDKKFVFPKNSIVMPKRTMVLSNKITQFTVSDAKNLKLITSTGEVAYNYGSSLLPIEIVPKVETPIQTLATEIVLEKPIANINEVKPEIKIPEKVETIFDIETPAEALSAASIESDIIPSSSKNSFVPIIMLVLFLGLSASGVYFVRRNRIVPDEDDFEIIDE